MTATRHRLARGAPVIWSLAEKSGDALAKIKAITGDPKHAYWKTWGPEHEAAVEEVQRLYREAYRG